MTDAAGAAGSTGGTSGTGTGGTATPPWFDGLDAETKGYVQMRGLDKKTPVEAFTEVSRAHREAQKLIGADEKQILRLPKDPTTPEGVTQMEAVWQRLGAPKEAKEYDFTGIKFADGTELDAGFVDHMREHVAKLHLPKDAALELTKAVVQFMDKSDASEAAEKAATIAKEKAELTKNWGANFAANKVVAQAAAAALGFKPEVIDAMEKSAGYAMVMEAFRQIGVKTGEDRFITAGTGNAGAGGSMSREQAMAQLNALKADTAWVKRYLAKGVEETRQMDNLQRIIVGVAA